MKFHCSKTDLSDSISIVQKAIKSNSTVAILDGILIQAESDTSVKLTGYDLETGIEADISSSVERKGSVVINSRLFGEIIRKLPDENVTIAVDDRNQIRIESGSAEYNIKGNSAESYPKIPIIENNEKIIIQQNILKKMITNTIFAVSRDETRQALTGCRLESDGNTLTMVAIDGYRMALRREDVGTDFPKIDLIIPAKALSEAARIFSGEDDDNEVGLFTSSNHILFDIGNIRIISRLIQGSFVNYEAIIQKNPKSIITADKKALVQSVERASIITMSDERRCPVQLAIDTNSTELTIAAKTEIGDMNESIDVNIEGESLDIDFNSRYLMDALKNIDEDSIRMEFNGNQGPCIIVPIEGNNFVYLILPIRR